MARDVCYGARTLLGSPGFAATAILSLALGVGANTAIFSILHALVLRDLPITNPQELVIVSRNNVSLQYPWFRYLREHTKTLAGVIAFRTAPSRLEIGGATERVTSVLVSGNYFDVLGVKYAAGSGIRDADDAVPGSGGDRGPVAVVSYTAWQDRFGGQPSLVGSQVRVNGQLFTVVGITARGFQGTEVGQSPELFLPMMMQGLVLPGLGSALTMPRSNWIRVIGRLPSGRSIQQAEAELTSLQRAYNQETILGTSVVEEEMRRRLLEQRITLLPGSAGLSSLRQEYSRPVGVLMALIGIVLLSACANIANLFLGRAASRRREIAIRLGLGASRARIVAQMFTEAVLVAAAGTGAGLVLARWLRDLLLTYLPGTQRLDATLDLRVLSFTLMVSIAAVLLFGLLPALQSVRVDVAPALKGDDGAGRGRRMFLRQGLVALQVAGSCVLLVATALFMRSLHNLMRIDPGFSSDDVLVASIDAPAGRAMQFYPQLLDEVRRLPGVSSAAVADSPPLRTNTGWNFFVPGFVPGANEPRDTPWVAFISAGYFATMRTPLLLGRDFEDRDLARGDNVLVVNETFARYYFGTENPLGRRVGTRKDVFDWEIVGVVKDAKYTGLREEPLRMAFVPLRAGPWASSVVLHVRSAAGAAGLAASIRATVQKLDRAVPVFDVHTVRDEIDRALLRERLVRTVTSIFGGLALLLAATGLYGTVSHGVIQRTRELGIRVAIGAAPMRILGLVLRDAAAWVVAGMVAGLAASWLLSRTVSGLLFSVPAADPLSVAIASGILIATTLAAAMIPARRAARIDPVSALRMP